MVFFTVEFKEVHLLMVEYRLGVRVVESLTLDDHVVVLYSLGNIR